MFWKNYLICHILTLQLGFGWPVPQYKRQVASLCRSTALRVVVAEQYYSCQIRAVSGEYYIFPFMICFPLLSVFQ